MFRSYRWIIWVTFLCYTGRTTALWPAPRKIQQGTRPIRLATNFNITFGQLDGQDIIASDLQVAIGDTLKQIQSDQHEILTRDRGRSLRAGLISPQADQEQLLKLTINLPPKGFSKLKDGHISDQSVHTYSILLEMRQPLRHRDEAYQLKVVPTAGSTSFTAVLSSRSALGVLRGLQTFSQLIYTTHHQLEKEDRLIRYLIGPIYLQDAPAFHYRGFLLDTSRNFYPLRDLYRTLDALSWTKLNVFHWHIVDAQSWPLVIPQYPELTQAGAYSTSQVYREDEIRNITLYANSKGIEVMLEIDTPGHTSVIGEAYPDLIVCKDAQPWANYAAEPPAGQLRIANDETLSFIKEIFRYSAKMIPGVMFSSGGDEINKKCFQDDPITQLTLQLKNITLNQALSKFVTQTHEIIRQSGKLPVVWEELVLDERLKLPLDTIIAVWRGSKNVRSVVDQGYQVIHAASDYSYLDCGTGGWLGNATNGTSWCDPFKTWQKIYSFDPYANITLAQRKLILGGQVLLWSEQADEQNLDSIVWPRALSAGEVYWTGGKPPLDVAEALPRMHDMRYRMVQRGIRATALQPHWCALRPGMCDLPQSV